MTIRRRRQSGIIEHLLDEAAAVKLIGEISNYAATLIDGILISSFLGTDAIAAYGLAMPLFCLLPIIGGTIASGVNKLCGGSIGRGDMRMTNRIFSSSLAGGLTLSALPALLLFLFSMPLSAALGASGSAEGLQVLVSDYLKGLALGAPAFVLILILIPYMQFSGLKSMLTVSITAMSALDVIFDLINLFVFKGGLYGMALASSLSYWIAALMMVLSFRRNSRLFRFSLGNCDIEIFMRTVAQGAPYIFLQGSNLLRSLVLNRIVIRFLPIETLSVYSIISSLQRVVYSPGTSIGSGTLLVTSMMYGEEDRQGLLRILKEGLRLSVLYNGILTVICLIIAPWIVGIYLPGSPALVNHAALGLRLLMLSTIPFSAQMYYRNYLHGIGRQKAAVFFTLLNELILAVASALGMTLLLGGTGFWLSFLMQHVLTVLSMAAFIMKENGGKRIDAECALLLPEEFGVAEENQITCDVREKEDILSFSEEVRQFCLQKHENKRNAMILSLAVEELGLNILNFGMISPGKHSEILLNMKADRWILRFRDDCGAFDPVAYQKSIEGNSPEEQFGLRLILSLAQDAVYIRSMNINNLRIQLSLDSAGKL